MSLINDLLGSLKSGSQNPEAEKTSSVQLQRRAGRGKITVFTSGKGGVGKSTVSSAVAGFLSKEGRKVLLIDTDTGLRTIDIMMGMEDGVTSNLYDVIEERVDWQKALVTRADIPNLYILPSDQSRSKESIRKDAFEKFLMNAARYFDHIIIDCPAGIEYGFTLAVSGCDEAYVVVMPEAPSIRGAAQVVRILEQRNISPVCAVLNCGVEKLEKGHLSASLEEVEDTLGVPVRAYIPMDLTVKACNHKGIPLALWSRPSPAVAAIRNFVVDVWLTPETIWEKDKDQGAGASSRTASIRRSAASVQGTGKDGVSVDSDGVLPPASGGEILL